MNVVTERKLKIIEKAVDLFAEKGFSDTSVQDITDACGISKGSFYLSFKSKNDLLLEIFQHFCNKLTNRMAEVNEQHIDTSDGVRLELFYQIYFEEISRYSNFILMQMREQTKTLNEEIMEILHNLRRKTYVQQAAVLRTVYGKEIEPHLPDLHMLVNGMLTSYMEIIIFNKDDLDFSALAKFLVSVTNSIVSNLGEPFLQKNQLIKFHVNAHTTLPTNEDVLKELRQILDSKLDEDTIITLEIIEQELRSKKPRKAVITGMMSNLNDVTETLPFVQTLQYYLKAL